MPSSREMLSGPDLGGGYLHQLSRDRRDDGVRFTYHAQEGGPDAQGPPRGPLGPLGFALPETPCPFGGRYCWHREFALPESESASVRRAYNRWRFVSGLLLEQRYGSAPVPIEAALREISARVLGRLEEEGVPYWIGGSTAAYLQGVPVAPHGIALGTSRAGVDAIGAALGESLIEPVAPTRWDGNLRHGARAFVGTLVDGVRVEWAAPSLAAPGVGGAREWSFAPDRVPTVTIERDGRRLRVSRLEFALVRAVERGDLARARAIAARLGPAATDRPLLDELLGDGRLEPRVRRAVGELLPPP